MNGTSSEQADALGMSAKGVEAMKVILAAAQPGSVFSEKAGPGGVTIITACEVMGGGGFGSGFGRSPDQAEQPGSQVGGGIGGGGGSAARPVAVIEVGPNGARVIPILDMTKLGLAVLASLGSLLFLWGGMKARRMMWKGMKAKYMMQGLKARQMREMAH